MGAGVKLDVLIGRKDFAMNDLCELGVVDAARLIRGGELSAVELTEALLARCDALDDALKVWVTLDGDAALAAARQRDAELAAEGVRGALHGVPVGIKDIYFTRGVLTTSGSKIFADFVPNYDATTVALLRQAGAIIMGKTVTTEFACGDPSPTVSPWNAAHTPGGSSSGSAVGAAVGMFPASLGSQTGGSIVRPASYNGVVGLKPTFGRVSRYGVYPVAESLDTMGPITRSVADAALMLNALAGHDIADPDSSERPTQDYLHAAQSQVKTPRLSIVPQFFMEQCDDETRANTLAAADKLRDAGAIVEEVTLNTDFDAALAAQRTLMDVEGAQVHEDNFATRADDYSTNVRELVARGLATSGLDYLKAKHFRREFARAVHAGIQGYDALLMPTTPAPAPPSRETTGDPKFQAVWTLGGFPEITLPSGLSEGGMPMGVQLVAAHFAEARLLATAAWCERALDVRLIPMNGSG